MSADQDQTIKSTVKPVHNGHPRGLKKWPFDRGTLIKVRFILAVTELYRLMLTGGRCSEVAVSSGLTVCQIAFSPFLLLLEVFELEDPL